MSLYSFKIRNNFKLLNTGDTVNPMVVTAQTGTQKFTEYHKMYTTNRYDILNKKTQGLSINQDNSFNQVKNTLAYFTTRNPAISLSALTPTLINNDYDSSHSITSGNTIVKPTELFKNITIPIGNNFNQVTDELELDWWVKKQTKKVINGVLDGEKVKYLSEIYPGITINFKFYDKNSGTFDDNNLTNGYLSNGFLQEEINVKNSFKKSFFRLYFYDSDNIRNRNLLLTEDIDVFGSDKPQFKLDRIYWFKEDELFRDTMDNRIVYMDARFFNAKTGEVVRFINLPNNIQIPIQISALSSNNQWRSSKINILNPKNNNGLYNFKVVPNVGANTNSTITLTQYTLKTQ